MNITAKTHCFKHYNYWKQLEDGFDYLKIYYGGSKYLDLIKTMTGTYRNIKVAIPGNQMFVVFETTSTVAKKGFKASIFENSISL